MGPETLTAYVKNRVWRTDPLDPPLADRFGPEPPETILIGAWRQTDESGFRANLSRSVRGLLAEHLKQFDETLADERAFEAFEGLIFLAVETNDISAVDVLTDAAKLAWQRLKPGYEVPGKPLKAGPIQALRPLLFRLLEGLASFSDDVPLRDLCEELLIWAPDGGLRGAAYFALAVWHPETLPPLLSRMAEDREIDMSNVAWTIAQFRPGKEAFLKACHSLQWNHRVRLRAALREALADQDLLAAMDKMIHRDLLKQTSQSGVDGAAVVTPIHHAPKAA